MTTTNAPIGPRPKRGRPKKGALFVPSKEQHSLVQALAAVGLEQPAIAKYIGVGVSTLKRHFKTDLRDGYDRIHAAVAGKLVQKALGGNTACIFFLLTRRFHWREVQAHAILGKNGEPISFDQLDDKSIDQLLQSFRTALGDPEARVDTASPKAEDEDC